MVYVCCVSSALFVLCVVLSILLFKASRRLKNTESENKKLYEANQYLTRQLVDSVKKYLIDFEKYPDPDCSVRNIAEKWKAVLPAGVSLDKAYEEIKKYENTK